MEMLRASLCIETVIDCEAQASSWDVLNPLRIFQFRFGHARLPFFSMLRA